MRTIAAILIVLFALVGVTYVAGRMQPEEHMATRSAIIAATPDDVWKRISDTVSEPKWRPEVKSVTANAPENGQPCYTEQIGITIKACVLRTDGERLRVVAVHDDKDRFGGTWTFLVQPGDVSQPNGNTTRLTITENASVHPALWRGAMLFTGMDRNVKQYLQDVSRSFSGTPEQS